jgi:predicted nucleotidyltransferase
LVREFPTSLATDIGRRQDVAFSIFGVCAKLRRPIEQFLAHSSFFSKASKWLVKYVESKSCKRIALEAARLLANGVETEYLHAKQTALLSLGLSSQTRLPSNRKINDCVGMLTREQLGSEEVDRRIAEMRDIAIEVMTVLTDFDPFLIGSVLTGKIKKTSDIDLHAYCDDPDLLLAYLEDFGYRDLQVEHVENRKGRFVHLKWEERDYPVEVTVYSWSWRDVVMYSSVTGKPMKRADLQTVQKLRKTVKQDA